jgi:hypothetical protein
VTVDVEERAETAREDLPVLVDEGGAETEAHVGRDGAAALLASRAEFCHDLYHRDRSHRSFSPRPAEVTLA